MKPGTDLERFGIVVDADTEIIIRWRAIKRILDREGYTGVPDHPDPSGMVIDHEKMPRIGIWIMPNNVLPGMLEDYLTFLVPAGDTLLERANHCLNEIPAGERRFAEVHRSKELIHTWLAWQEDPGTPLGQAITKRYFEAEGPHVVKFLAWLTRLFA